MADTDTRKRPALTRIVETRGARRPGEDLAERAAGGRAGDHRLRVAHG